MDAAACQRFREMVSSHKPQTWGGKKEAEAFKGCSKGSCALLFALLTYLSFSFISLVVFFERFSRILESCPSCDSVPRSVRAISGGLKPERCICQCILAQDG